MMRSSGAWRCGGVPADPRTLRTAWRERSSGAGWAYHDDWWSPAVDNVAQAVCAGRGLARAFSALGRARGRAGIGIGETIGDIHALFGVLGWSRTPMDLVRAAAEGWADIWLTRGETCEDPLTGLASTAYLRTRLAEAYRHAEGGGAPVPGSATLLVVEMDADGDAWRRLARAVAIGHGLRRVFTGGETMALVGTSRVTVVCPLHPDPAPRAAGLQQRLGETARVWLEPLPPDHRSAMALIDRLSH